MSKNIDITVIIPIHEKLSDKNLELLTSAIESVEKQELKGKGITFVVAKGLEIEKQLKKFKKTNIIVNGGDTDFHSQINLAVNQIDTEFFSILEFDDEYSLNWFKNVDKYKKAYPEVSILTPISIDTDPQHKFIGLSNEIAWANSFSEELGFLDNSSLLSNHNININGAVINTEVFKSVGSFKTNLSLMNGYEFLLRVTFNAHKVLVVPKFGYKHMNLRANSLFERYKEEINQVDANWWLAKAKNEYFFPNQREITDDVKTV